MQLGRLGNQIKLQVAETCVGTRALGPGLRSVVWVQGCPFRCRGCIAPDWIPREGGREVDPADLAATLLAQPGITGFTFSGGEPMSQAAALARVITIARQQRDLTLICFTGYRLAELRARPPGPGVASLLAPCCGFKPGQNFIGSGQADVFRKLCTAEVVVWKDRIQPQENESEQREHRHPESIQQERQASEAPEDKHQQNSHEAKDRHDLRPVLAPEGKRDHH